MAVTFPSSPTANQIVTDAATGATWRWDAPTTRWVMGISGINFLPLSGGSLTGPLGLPGNATTNLQAVPLQQLNAIRTGVTNGSAAAAGQIGEYLFVTNQQQGANTVALPVVLYAAPVPFTTIASLSLTAGDWDIHAAVDYKPGTAVGYTLYGFCISPSTVTDPNQDYTYWPMGWTFMDGWIPGAATVYVGTLRLNTTANSVVLLRGFIAGRVAPVSGIMNASFYMYARRVR